MRNKRLGERRLFRFLLAVSKLARTEFVFELFCRQQWFLRNVCFPVWNKPFGGNTEFGFPALLLGGEARQHAV